MYFGGEKIFQSTPLPYIIFEFPNGKSPSASTSNNHGVWTQLSTSPNRWKWSCDAFWNATLQIYGWVAAFSSIDAVPKATLTTSNFAYVDVIEVGGDLSKIVSVDRMFSGCDAIRNIPDFSGVGFEPTITAGMFANCTNVTGGALALYQYCDALTNPVTNKSGMFTNCGINTQQGLAELDQIPVAWGGNYVPVAAGVIDISLDSQKYSWTVTNDGGIDFENDMGFEIYTTSSLSQYAGINMKRSTIKWKSGSAIPNSTQLYYYPSFFQGPVNGSTPTTGTIYLMLTENYNGTLAGGTTAGDMPGTLDNTTIGPFAYKTGTYDSTSAVHFGFYVTDKDPATISGMADKSSLLTDKWGLLNNNYFSATMELDYINS